MKVHTLRELRNFLSEMVVASSLEIEGEEPSVLRIETGSPEDAAYIAAVCLMLEWPATVRGTSVLVDDR